MRARLLMIGALLALAGAPAAQARGCARTLPHGPTVPAPVLFHTACGVFELRRDGSVVYGRSPRWAPAWAPGAISHPDPLTWVAHPHRRLAVYRDGRLLWHSHFTGGSDDVAVGHGHVAFTVWHHDGMSAWLAPIGGRERMVAWKVASSGITFTTVPARKTPTVITTGSNTSKERVTKVCNAVTISQAGGMGSRA